MAISITGFDGQTLNSTTAYRAGLPHGSSAPKAVALSLMQRGNSHPTYVGLSQTEWRFPLRISGVAGAGVTAAQFRENVEQWFDPRGSGTARNLTATWHDGTAVQIGVHIESLDLTGDAGTVGSLEYITTCVAPLPVWEASSLTTSSSNPATVTNAGNTDAYPTIELTTSTHVTRRACTVTGAGAGGGVVAQPVKFVLVDGLQILTSNTANPAVITTNGAHGLTTGDSVTIAGHSDTNMNGTFTVSSATPAGSTFTIPVNGNTQPGSGSGGALILPANYDSDLDGLTAANFAVYVEGISVPCYVVNEDGALTYIWALIDTSADGVTATQVDIVYGTGIDNPLAGMLTDGGMSWDDHTNCTNDKWEWDDWATLRSNPKRPGVWRPARTGNHDDASSATYKITTVSAGSIVISLGASGTYDNSADSMVMEVGATAGTMTNLRRITATLDGSNARAFVRYQVADSDEWLDGWTSSANATVTTAIGLTNAVRIAIGLENFGSTADPATLTITPTSDVALTLASTPTVVVGSATDLDFYDGDYTINGRTLTFTDFCCPDGTLTIDAAARSIESSVAGPFYGPDDDDAQMYAFSHPDRWFILSPGSNTVTDGLTATDVIKHRGAFS